MGWREIRPYVPAYMVTYLPSGKHEEMFYGSIRHEWVDPDEEERRSCPWSDYQELAEMKRRAKEVQKTKGKYSPHQEPLLQRCPEIGRILWDCWYDDGAPRELGKLSINLTSSGVAIQLTDPGERATAFTNAETLAEALDLLEQSLAGKSDPWRPWPKGFGRK